MGKIFDFITQAEEFKKTDKYKEIPDHLRDFFNEEIGRFKVIKELVEKCS